MHSLNLTFEFCISLAMAGKTKSYFEVQPSQFATSHLRLDNLWATIDQFNLRTAIPLAVSFQLNFCNWTLQNKEEKILPSNKLKQIKNPDWII